MMVRTACRLWPALFVVTLFGPLSACSSDEQKPQEPVAPATEKTPYPEDPGLAAGDQKQADAAADQAKPEDTENVGSLTEDDKKAGPAATEPPPPMPSEAAAPVDKSGNQIGGAFSDNPPNYQPAPEAVPPEEPKAGHHGRKHRGSKGEAQAGARTTYYVKAKLLNVRSKPSLKGKVVSHLSAGAQVQAEVHGKWAKIDEGQWVSAKYLSETPGGAKKGRGKAKHHKAKHSKGAAPTTNDGLSSPAPEATPGPVGAEDPASVESEGK